MNIRQAVDKVIEAMAPGEVLSIAELNSLRLRQMGHTGNVPAGVGMGATSTAARYYIETHKSHVGKYSERGGLTHIERL